MTSFLSWLYAAASKVYQFFGSAYWTLYNGALNAWNWAVSQANNALNAAKTYAYQLFQQVGNAVSITASWVIQQIQNAIGGLQEDIVGLFDWVEYKFSNLSNIVNQWIADALGGVLEFINNVRNEISGSISGIISYITGWVTSSFAWLLTIKNRLIDLLSVFTTGTIQEILLLLNDWKNTVVLFFQNPVVFILDIIQDKVLDFLNYVIAWALGTTKYDLPNQPPWKR